MREQTTLAMPMLVSAQTAGSCLLPRSPARFRPQARAATVAADEIAYVLRLVRAPQALRRQVADVDQVPLLNAVGPRGMKLLPEALSGASPEFRPSGTGASWENADGSAVLIDGLRAGAFRSAASATCLD